jgi:CBS domain-containing protein
MKTKDIMKTPAITVGPGMPLKGVARIMVENAISIVPVVDDSGALVGVLTEADVLGAQTIPTRGEILLRPERDGAMPGTAASVMSREVVSAGELAEATDLLPLMVERHLKGMPVLSGDVVTGIVARRDLLRLICRDDADIHDEVMSVLDQVGEEAFSVEVADGVVTINRPLERGLRRRVERLVKAVPGAMAVVFEDSSKE